VKKIIFWGDGVLAGPYGFAELLLNHIFLHHPRAEVSTSIYGGEAETWQDAARNAPFHVIGKAPDLVLLGFGYSDLAAGRKAGEIESVARGAVALMVQKTQCRVSLLPLIASFFAGEDMREECRAFNRHLRSLAGPRVDYVDLETRVEHFLAEHQMGAGEKHALHMEADRLTPLGRLFLAHHAFHLISWPVGAEA
jgi:hypothetical protein